MAEERDWPQKMLPLHRRAVDAPFKGPAEQQRRDCSPPGSLKGSHQEMPGCARAGRPGVMSSPRAPVAVSCPTQPAASRIGEAATVSCRPLHPPRKHRKAEQRHGSARQQLITQITCSGAGWTASSPSSYADPSVSAKLIRAHSRDLSASKTLSRSSGVAGVPKGQRRRASRGCRELAIRSNP